MSDEQAGICRSCVNSQIPEVEDSPDCSIFDTQMCTAISTCDSCEGCRYEIERFLDCAFIGTYGCNIDCGDNPTQSPAVQTIAPSAERACSARQESYRSCFETSMTEDEANTCRSCVNSQIPDPEDIDDCGEAQTQVCSALDACDCDGCISEIESFLDCAFVEENGCNIECFGVVPTSEPTVAVPLPTITPTTVLRVGTTGPTIQGAKRTTEPTIEPTPPPTIVFSAPTPSEGVTQPPWWLDKGSSPPTETSSAFVCSHGLGWFAATHTLVLFVFLLAI
jgi:hypothetical protein